VSRGKRSVGALVALLLLAGCAATTLTAQWKNPAVVHPHLSRMLVVGVSSYPSVRRVFEDEFVAQLRAAGQTAEPSYRFIPEGGPTDAAALANASQKAGAQGVIVTRLVGVEQIVDVAPGPYWGAWPWMGYYGWYPGPAAGVMVAPYPYQYTVVLAETSLYLEPTGELLWSGSTRTVAGQDLIRQSQRYAKLIIDSLSKQGIL
jgi:hypothetical protein